MPDKNEIKESILRFADNSSSIEEITAQEVQGDDDDGNPKIWHEIRVKVKEHPEVYTLTNARESTRTWVQLNTVKDFVREQCPKYVKARLKAKKPVIGVTFNEKKSE